MSRCSAAIACGALVLHWRGYDHGVGPGLVEHGLEDIVELGHAGGAAGLGQRRVVRVAQRDDFGLRVLLECLEEGAGAPRAGEGDFDLTGHCLHLYCLQAYEILFQLLLPYIISKVCVEELDRTFAAAPAVSVGVDELPQAVAHAGGLVDAFDAFIPFEHVVDEEAVVVHAHVEH